jgi:hypothetical protein
MMAPSEAYSDAEPWAGVCVVGSLQMNIQTTVASYGKLIFNEQ